MSGRVVHFEIPFDDARTRLTPSTAHVFGWELAGDAGDGLHARRPPARPVPRALPSRASSTAGMLRRENPNDSPILVIDVADIDAALARVEEHGGQTLLGRQAVGDMGWAAYFKDVEGNAMGLWQSRDQSA